MKEIAAYQCDHCHKYYKHTSSAKRHEDNCFHNRETKSCATCINFPHVDFGEAPTCNHFEKDFEKGENGRYKLTTNCPVWEIHPRFDDY